MRVLLTGHEGYIGAVMVPILQRAAVTVVGLDSGFFVGCDCGASPPPIPTIRRDLRDVTPDDLQGFDAVIHLAAISNDPLGDLNPDCTYDINHHASTHLAKCAKTAGVERFIYSSSCAVYGAASPEDILAEEAHFSPLTPYAESKVRVEADLANLADDSFSPIYMRNATVYGFSPRLRGDLVVNNLAGWAFTTGRVYIKSDGTPWRPLVHVEDVCAAFLAVLQAARHAIHNQAFNVGRSGENYRIRDVADLVQQRIPGSTVEYADGGGPDPRCYRVDFSKIESVLPGFEPTWTVALGVAQLHEAYQRIGLRGEDLEGDRYLRIKHIQRLLELGQLDTNLRWKDGSEPPAI